METQNNAEYQKQKMLTMCGRVVQRNSCYQGACLAAVFMNRPYLRSFKLKLSQVDEFHDHGHYHYEKLTVSEVCLIEGVPIPGDLADNDIAEDIESKLGYNGYEVHCWYCTARDKDVPYQELSFHFDRSAIEPILSRPLIDGNEVFDIFFPEIDAPSGLKT